MQVQKRLQNVTEVQHSYSDNLSEKIAEIMESYSSSLQAKENYLFAELGSTIGFKIELKFSESHLLLKGSFLYCNGRPVNIPQIYWDIILKKLQFCNQVPIRFKINRENSILFFQSGVKLDNTVNDPIPIITQHFRSILSSFPQIYNELVFFGVVKKFSIKYLKFTSMKMSLLLNVVNVINDKQQTNPQIFNKQQNKKGSVFKFYQKIQQIQSHKMEDQKLKKSNQSESSSIESMKKGGYFQVEKRLCKITQSQTKGNIIMQMAVKKLRKDQENVSYCKTKIEKQFRILHEIEDPQHSLAYWVQRQQNQGQKESYPKFSDKIYMEYVEQTLDDCIYSRHNNIKDILNYSKQIIQAVSILQRSGIVHRDLKPDNLLIQSNKAKNSVKQSQIKVIDFGQSSLLTDTFSKKPEDLLGSTLPYSPIQCYVSCQQGYNSSQIDLWSVGLILYQIFYKKNPITYSRCFASDIYRGWKLPDQFSLFLNLFKKNGIRIIQLVFCVLTLNSVCVEQKDRISLRKMQRIVNLLYNFVELFQNQ